jgi:plasmid stabilization system protein ParE
VKPVRFGADASVELAEASTWYEVRQAGLGARLLDEVDRLLPLLSATPAAFPRLLDVPAELEVRRALLPRFPFAIVFLELEREVRILAVAHARRRPGYWLDRLRP